MTSIKGSRPDVPVFVDASVSGAGFAMTRCSFLLIECSDPSPGWTLGLGKGRMPFLMLNLTGIVQGPFGKALRFRTAPLIENFFQTVENFRSPVAPAAEFLVETADLWLPDSLFRKRATVVGDVFRVPRQLFNLCLAFREGTLEQRRFLAACENSPEAVEFSAEETEAFATWHGLQVDEARKRFPKNPESRLKRTDDADGANTSTL